MVDSNVNEELLLFHEDFDLGNNIINVPHDIYVPNYGTHSSVTYAAAELPNDTWNKEDYGPNTAIIDSNSIELLDKFIAGDIISWEEIEQLEYVIRAYTLHETIYWLYPSVLVAEPKTDLIRGGSTEGDRGQIIYPYDDVPCSLSSFIKETKTSAYAPYSGYLYVIDGRPLAGHKFWLNNYKELMSGNRNKINKLFQKSFEEYDFYKKKYYLSAKAIGAGSYYRNRDSQLYETKIIKDMTLSIPESVFQEVDSDWANSVIGSQIGLNVRLGPFMSIVLNNASKREELPEAILELRDKFLKARHALWDMYEDALTETNLKKAIEKQRNISKSIKSIIPAAFPQKTSPLVWTWEITKQLYELAISGGLSAIKSAADVLHERNKDLIQVSTIDASRITAESLMEIDDALPKLLRKHLSKHELENIGIR